MHILSPETDNCPSWISGRERMTIENISWSISTKECCRPRRGWTRDLLVSSRTAHPTEPPRPYRKSSSACPSVQSNLGIFCLITYTIVSTDSVSGQQRSRLACAYAQADQGLCCPHINKGPFPVLIIKYIIYSKYWYRQPWANNVDQIKHCRMWHLIRVHTVCKSSSSF